MQKNMFRTGLLAAAVAFSLAACHQQNTAGNASAPTASAAATASDAAASGAMAGMTDVQKASYLLGTGVGGQFNQMKAEGMELDQEALIKGLQAALASEPLPISPEEANAIMQKYQTEQMARVTAIQQEAAKTNQEKGKAFLEENKAKEGVKTTASGLQYSVKTEGTGKRPAVGDIVTVHYEGKLIDGTVFDSSIKRGEPAVFKLDQVIKGWSEGLQLMKEGGEYTLYIPAELAYGPEGTPGIPPNAVLVFDVKLIKVGQ